MTRRRAKPRPAPERTVSPAELVEERRRLLAADHPGWTITPGQPWTARKGGITLTAADAIALHDEFVRISKGMP